MRRHDTFRKVLLLALSLLAFLPFVGRRDVVTSHEARVVQTAQQMAESGWPWNAKPVTIPMSQLVNTPTGERLIPREDGGTVSVNPWIVPVMNGQIRLQKPPLPYWCAATLYRIFGVSESAARFVPALLGAIGVLLVWDLARMRIGRVGALYAALVWISSYFVVDEFRKAMADPYLAFFTLATIWAWFRSYGSGGKWLIVGYSMLAMGILAKGPIILLFVPTILVIDRICAPRRFRSIAILKRWHFHAIGILLLIALTLPWAIAVVRGVPNVIELWRFESIGALSDKDENARPFWFYLPNLLLITLPWTPIWLMGLIKPILFKNRRRWFLPACTVAIVAFFSIPHPKKNAYLLPLMPIQAMLVADGLRWLTLLPKRRPIRIAVKRTVVTSIGLIIATQIFLSGFRASAENARSPRMAAAIAERLAEESGGKVALFYSRLPDEVTAYLPLQIGDAAAKEYILVADDRNHDADQIVAAIDRTPAGVVIAVENVRLPDAGVKRWKVYRILSQVQ